MKVTVLQTDLTTTEVEVDLPLYRRQGIGDYWPPTEIYMRVDQCANGTLRQIAVSVTNAQGFPHTKAEIEITDLYSFNHSGAAYTLGIGQYRSSADEFTRALNFARSLIAMVEG